MPTPIEPCLALTKAKPPTGPDWVFEIKWDGYRLAVHIEPGRVPDHHERCRWSGRQRTSGEALFMAFDLRYFDGHPTEAYRELSRSLAFDVKA